MNFSSSGVIEVTRILSMLSVFFFLYKKYTLHCILIVYVFWHQIRFWTNWPAFIYVKRCQWEPPYVLL